MSVNFIPDKGRMFKEVEQCIALDRLDNLMSFCNSCSFKPFKDKTVSECHECKVQLGIKKLSKGRRKSSRRMLFTPDAESAEGQGGREIEFRW